MAKKSSADKDNPESSTTIKNSFFGVTSMSFWFEDILLTT
jgi:hypothetical protein